jgi:solute carrier family 39 (zinc transporter), member 1/2/3
MYQPYALAIAMLSIFMLFIVELVAFRWGTAKLASIGVSHDPHGHGIGGHASHGPESPNAGARMVHSNVADGADGGSWEEKASKGDVETSEYDSTPSSVVDSPLAQIIGVMILEFGVLLHR